MPGSILIIDDEEQLRKLLARIIKLEGYDVEEAPTIKIGSDILKRKNIDVVLCDVKLPDGNGVDFVKEAKAKMPFIEIILLTAYGNIPDGVRAIKNGAFDYITKGNDNDRILPLLSQAVEKVAQQKRKAIKVNENLSNTFSSIIGHSAIIQKTISLAQKVAATHTNVLLLGETGTGKEVFAKAIHNASSRKNKSFVAINCSAFTKDLLEAELFGYKAGAFTGAIKDKKGLVEIADEGTLFLDEIGELNIDLQAKLLRLLENEEFIKLGDTKTTKVNIRIIAASNRNIQNEIVKGNFREDLLYRLNTFTITLPPLKERREDIEALATYFLNIFKQREEKNLLQLSADTLQQLNNYHWAGNIRELRNVIERAVILADDDIIQPQDLPSEIQQQTSPSNSFSLVEIEKTHIRKILQYTDNNKTKTAKLLGIGLATLYRKIEEYGLNK